MKKQMGGKPTMGTQDKAEINLNKNGDKRGMNPNSRKNLETSKGLGCGQSGSPNGWLRMGDDKQAKNTK